MQLYTWSFQSTWSGGKATGRVSSQAKWPELNSVRFYPEMVP